MTNNSDQFQTDNAKSHSKMRICNDLCAECKKTGQMNSWPVVRQKGMGMRVSKNGGP